MKWIMAKSLIIAVGRSQPFVSLHSLMSEINNQTKTRYSILLKDATELAILNILVW